MILGRTYCPIPLGISPLPHSPTPSQNSVAVIDREREREREKEGGLFTGLGFHQYDKILRCWKGLCMSQCLEQKR